jgi:hypothetical protein
VEEGREGDPKAADLRSAETIRCLSRDEVRCWLGREQGGHHCRSRGVPSDAMGVVDQVITDFKTTG